MAYQYHLSASSVQAFKACPQRFRLAYREGLRKIEDTDAQRIGTNWHGIHETYAAAFRAWRPVNDTESCNGGGDTQHEYAFNAVVEYVTERYAEIPEYKEREEWEVERQVLLTSFIGHQWRWSEDPVESLDEELAFDLPLHHPEIGLPMLTGEVIRRGKIDHIAVWQDRVVNVERKSTSKAIAADSDYWERSKKDTQVSMYALAMSDMEESGDLPAKVKEKLDSGLTRGNTLYDVWHKPTIKPTKLSQKDTAAFLETGEYFGTRFSVEVSTEEQTEIKELKSGNKEVKHVVPTQISVDGEALTFEISKTYKPAVRESPSMFSARLLHDMYERPDFYFARKEIARSEQDVAKFRKELYNIYQAKKAFSVNNCWYENEAQCRATFTCQFVPICYGPGADAVCDGKTEVAGFKRIFDVTIEEKRIDA